MKKSDTRIRKQNMKIYFLYRMLSIDHIFYYAIDFMFLTQVKNISPSEVVLGQSFFALFMVVLQILVVIAIDKIGKKKCTILGNLFLAIYVLLIMNCSNLGILILAQFTDAIGFALKNTADKSLIRNSIPKSSKQGEIFSKLEGKGLKNYYYLAAITSVLAGLIYEINPYIPMVFSFSISIISLFMSLAFEETEDSKNSVEIENVQTYLKELKKSFKFILKSKRLKAMLMYIGIFWGTICLMSTCINSLLKDKGMTALIIAIVSAINEICSGIGSKKQLDFHNKLKNKSLTTILIITLTSIFVIGIVGMLKIDLLISISIILVAVICLNFVKGIHNVLASRYLQNFSNDKILPKVYAVSSISENIFRVAIGLIGSYLLDITNTSNAIIVIGIMFGSMTIIVISYMKPRLGLKPEEYKKEDIEFE